MDPARPAAPLDPPPARPGRTRARAAAALLLGLVLAGALGELAARAAGPRPPAGLWSPAYDPLLGFVPEPGYRARADAAWRVDIDADGLRSNGGPRPPGRPILAVGDSFTFGEEVSNESTWPALLERELGRPVLNGGVAAYGFDQTVLRAERLLSSRRVQALIASLIFDDLRRCQCSLLGGAPKPWFAVSADGLELRNVPVPRPPATRPLLGPLLRSSRLLAWIERVTGTRERCEPGPGTDVARLLIGRLGALARRGLPVLLLVQGPVPPGRGTWPRFESSTRPALHELERVAAQNGLATLDLVDAAWDEVRQRPARKAELFLHEGVGHMTPAGNAWVAAHVAERLRELGWVER